MEGEKTANTFISFNFSFFCLKFSSHSFCIIVSRYPSRHCSPFSTVYALISHSNVWVWENVFFSVWFLNVATFRVRLMYCNIFFFVHFICLVLCVFFRYRSSRFRLLYEPAHFMAYVLSIITEKKWRIHEQRQKNSSSFTNDTQQCHMAMHFII